MGNIDMQELVNIVYTDYRGETSFRQVVPRKIWFDATDRHPAKQWMLDAYDVEEKTEKSFAMKDIKTWYPVP